MLYKSKFLTLETMVYSWYVDEYCFLGPSGCFYSYIYIYIYISYDVDWDRLGTSGRALCTRETLPDF